MNRRACLKALLASGGLAALPFQARAGQSSLGHVLVVGGGYGGATLARYLKLWGGSAIRVTLVERQPSFVSCPVSNLVLAGARQLAEITVPYTQLRDRWGIEVVQDTALAVDVGKQGLRLASGTTLHYDRLVLSPGVDFMWETLPGLASDTAREQIPHAWKAGPQTLNLRQQLESMPDGGVFALSIPRALYRCPPGPYERACLVAAYFKRHKPRSKVVILDANDDIQSKKGLFLKAWSELYPGMIEYRSHSEVKDVDAASRTAILDFDRFQADVLNVIVPQRAGAIAAEAGLTLTNGRWVAVDWLSMSALGVPNVHVLGDAVFPAPGMPKSGHMANQQAKLAAAAILNLQAGRAPHAEPVLMNTCYSYVSEREAIHVASVHQYDEPTHTMQPVKGAGGLSAAASAAEAVYAEGWARNIWADMLG